MFPSASTIGSKSTPTISNAPPISPSLMTYRSHLPVSLLNPDTKFYSHPNLLRAQIHSPRLPSLQLPCSASPNAVQCLLFEAMRPNSAVKLQSSVSWLNCLLLFYYLERVLLKHKHLRGGNGGLFRMPAACLPRANAESGRFVYSRFVQCQHLPSPSHQGS